MAEGAWKKKLTIVPRPPWNPSADDGALMLAMTMPADASAPRRVLVLGVTPQIMQLDWPRGTDLLAVDSNLGTIGSVWLPHPTLPSHAVCAWWHDMPISDGAVGAVVGDGSLNALPSLEAYKRVFTEVRRVLARDGVLVLRCFLRPDQAEDAGAVVAMARKGAFPTTGAFHLRFAFALTDATGSVGLMEIRDRFNALVPDRDELAHAAGWPRSDIDRVDLDKDSHVRLTFPTEGQWRDACGPLFTIERMARGTYTQAEYCPTLLFRPV